MLASLAPNEISTLWIPMLPDYLYTMTFDKCSLSSLSICLKRIFFNFSKQSPHISKPSFTKSTDQNHQRSFPEIKVLLSSKLATCCYGVFCIERSNQTGNFQRESLLMGLCAWVQCPLLLEMCVCVCSDKYGRLHGPWLCVQHH